MKKLTIIFALLMAISCDKPAENVKIEETNVEKEPVVQNNFDFLLGNWSRTDDEEGKQTFESWEKLNDSTYIGISYTMYENDTVWQENVILSPIEKIWHYQVSMPETNQSTNFRLTEQTAESFTCENPENEFPKIIKYWKNGNNLNAEISDGTTKIPFEFRKI